MKTIGALIGDVLCMWEKAGLTVGPGVADRITAFEDTYAVQLPEDVRAFFGAQGGMAEGEADSNAIRFWAIDEVRPAAIEVPDGDRAAYDGYFVFADYSLWAHGYALRLSRDQPTDVAIVGGDRPIRVALSFAEFLEKYVYDTSSLF
jgi:hypothetical protein